MKMWVARDKSGDLYAYPNKPLKNECGFWEGISFGRIPDLDCFLDIAWSDEEPTEVELVIKK